MHEGGELNKKKVFLSSFDGTKTSAFIVFRSGREQALPSHPVHPPALRGRVNRLFQYVDLNRKSPDSGEHQYKSRT